MRPGDPRRERASGVNAIVLRWNHCRRGSGEIVRRSENHCDPGVRSALGELAVAEGMFWAI